jgi:UPF0042 nucleotide-binding protein
MSGSGRTTAIHALEDQGFYCIDNLPTELVPQLVALCAGSSELPERVALGIDLRDGSYLSRWQGVRAALELAGHKVFVVFLDAPDEVLLRRYSETRRGHPLANGRDLSAAISMERSSLAAMRDRADVVIDTGKLSIHDLKRRMGEVCVGDEARKGLELTIKSFGFKFGPANDADLVFDVRCIPNPYFVEELKAGTGLDEAVSSFVLEHEATKGFLTKAQDLLEFLLPYYQDEGKAYLTVAVGCTGGRHRSVAVAEEIARRLRQGRTALTVVHRDVER